MSIDQTPANPLWNIASILAANPNVTTSDIPAALAGIAETIKAVESQARADAAPPEKKKRRRRAGGKVVGWPAGVSRNAYKTWKEAQQAKGVSENLNPQELKRQVDAGEYTLPDAEPAAAEPAAPAAEKKTAAPAAAKKKPAVQGD